MKHLKEIDPTIYETGRDVCAQPDDIEDDVDALFIARFWTPKLIVEGLVSVHLIDENLIDLKHVSDDGELVDMPYETQISDDGILGALTLRDGIVMYAREGYLKQYGNTVDDELSDMIAQYERELVPVHVTLGGAMGDAARRELAF